MIALLGRTNPLRWAEGWLVALVLGVIVCGPAGAEEKKPAGVCLMTIPAEGGRPTKLIEEPGWHCGSPRWSPDARWVAYDVLPMNESPTANHFTKSKIVVVRADGTGRVEVGRGGIPTWSPDGRSLAWHTYSPHRVVVADFDPDEGRGFAPEEVVGHWGSPVWTSDPRYLVTLSGESLAICDLHRGTESILHDAEYASITFGYSLSPDDKRLSYRTRPGQLVLADLRDDQVADRLLLKSGAGYSTWSPDGKRLAVAWWRKGNLACQIYTFDPDEDVIEPARVPGQDPQRHATQPDWSSDGRLVYGAFPEPVSE